MIKVPVALRVQALKRLTSLVAALLLLTLGLGQAQAKQASSLGLTPGYLIIGSYLIQKDALTEDNYQAARATLTDPSSGLYYKSEFANGEWLAINQAIGLDDLKSTNLGSIVSQGKIDQVRLTIWIDQTGQITSLQTEEEILGDIIKLERDKGQLEAEHEAVLEAGELVQAVELSLQIEEVAAQLKFLQALLNDEQEQARAELKKINNRAALLEELATDAPLETPDEQAEQEGEAEESVDEPEEDPEPPSEEMEEPGELEEDEESELPAELDALLIAKEEVEAELVKARQAGDHALLAGLEATLKNLETKMVQLLKEMEWQKKAELEETLAGLAPDDPKADELAEQLAAILEELSELEKGTYTQEELAALEYLGIQLENSLPNTEALLVEQVISIDVPIKFDVPPILTNERVFIQLRPISESFGALVIWDAHEKSVTISKDEIMIICYIDSLTAYRNGEPIQLDVPPQIIEGRTMVPLRFVMEGLGLELEWISETKQIIIKQGKEK